MQVVTTKELNMEDKLILMHINQFVVDKLIIVTKNVFANNLKRAIP